MSDHVNDLMSDVEAKNPGQPESKNRRAAEMYGTPGNYVDGANIAGFIKVADAMLDQGLV